MWFSTMESAESLQARTVGTPPNFFGFRSTMGQSDQSISGMIETPSFLVQHLPTCHGLAVVGAVVTLHNRRSNSNSPRCADTWIPLLLVWSKRLPQFDLVAVGIVDPREPAIVFVLTVGIDLDAFSLHRSSSASRSSTM
jgi:hypothetical protein